MAKRPASSRTVHITPEVYDRLLAVADERLMGANLLADRLLALAMDDLAPVDALGRHVANTPPTGRGGNGRSSPAGDTEIAR